MQHQLPVYTTTREFCHNPLLTSPGTHAIVCATGFETRQEAVAAAVKGDISTGKITAFRLLGRLGRTCPGVSSCTFRTQSPLFRVFENTGKATERPRKKEA